jgi:hypothetical protein
MIHTQWMTVLEEYNKYLWQTVAHLFTLLHRSTPLSLSLTFALYQELMDGIETCTPSYTASLMRALRCVLGTVIMHTKVCLVLSLPHVPCLLGMLFLVLFKPLHMHRRQKGHKQPSPS